MRSDLFQIINSMNLLDTDFVLVLATASVHVLPLITV